jgi:hypothetical protein
MKGKVLLVVVILSAMVSQAQRFHGGIMAGGVMSQVQGDSYGGFNKPGFYGGAFVSLDLAKIHSVQMEIDFIQKGSRRNSDPENGDYDFYLFRANYIEIPLLYQVRILKKFGFEIGPAIDVLVGSYEESEDGEITNLVPMRPVTYSALAGVWYQFIPRMKVDFRFSMSVTSMRDGETTGYYKRFGTWGQYDDLLALTLWYRFK